LALADEFRLDEVLLASGAPIWAMNVVRKQFRVLVVGGS